MEKNYDELPAEETLATPGVLDKYQAAGKIANGNISPFLFSHSLVNGFPFQSNDEFRLTLLFSRPRKSDR